MLSQDIVLAFNSGGYYLLGNGKSFAVLGTFILTYSSFHMANTLAKTDGRIVLLALGNLKFEVLNHVNARRDLEIIKIETRLMENREKGLGLKVVVRRHGSKSLAEQHL